MIPNREERYAPTVIRPFDEWDRGVLIGMAVAVTRNGEHFVAGEVAGIGATEFQVTDDMSGSPVTVPHDPGPEIMQVVTIDYARYDAEDNR